MQINDSHQLMQAINNLKAQKIVNENKLINDLYDIKNLLNPIHHINKALPRKLSKGETFNNLFDEIIVDVSDVIKSKLVKEPTNSFTKTVGNNVLKNAVTMAINKNSFKIKTIGLAVLKNIF